MAENNAIKIRYSYRHDDIQQSAVRHAFDYLSAISGLKFIEDENMPDIWKDCDQPKPLSAKLIIKRENGKDWSIQAESTFASGLCRKITYDAIEKIINKLSLAVKLGPHSMEHHVPQPSMEPTLSEIINNFVGLLSDAGLIPQNTRDVAIWPNESKFGLVISHDIDIAQRSVLGGFRILLKNALPGGIPAIFDSVFSSIGLCPNPYDAVAEWLKLENELGIKSTFFIFAGKRTHAYDPTYRLEKLKKSIDMIKSNGNEIALHSSIGSYNGEHIIESKSLLEKFCNTSILGIRPHYLSASFPEYWTAAFKAGIEYSSSLGFDNEIGFFNGLDLPFYPFDNAEGKAVGLLEIPMGMMDCGLIGSSNADSEQIFEKGKELIDRTAASGGLIVLDWHQRAFYNRDYPGWLGLFLKLVQYAKETGAHFTNMRDLVMIMKSRVGNPL